MNSTYNEPGLPTQNGAALGHQQSSSDRSGSITYTRLSSRELGAGSFDLEFLIDGAMAAGQPLIIAGPQKTLKTSVIVDAAVSLATAKPFLRQMKVNRACRVAVMTGESGLATIQETARRVCIAAGVHLEECDNLVWSPDIPRFGNARHLVALERFLASDELEVLFVDPAYLAMPAADAGNLMAQGELLRSISELCQAMGVTMVLAHHTRKNTGGDLYEPPELHHIAWAGFQEFARQWWLLGRRERYEPGTGDHKLWLSIGGSAGHGAMWAMDVREGVRNKLTPRVWEVTLQNPARTRDEARQNREQRKAERQAAKDAEQLDHDRGAVVDAMTKLGKPETLTNISAVARISGARTRAAIVDLVADGHAREAIVVRGNKQQYDGFELCADDHPDSPRQHTQTNGQSG